MHFAGFAGLHAPRAMFLTFAGRSAALVVNSGSGMLLLGFAGIFADDCRQVCRCARCCARLGLWRDENCGGPAVAARLELSSSWTRLLMCPLRTTTGAVSRQGR